MIALYTPWNFPVFPVTLLRCLWSLHVWELLTTSFTRWLTIVTCSLSVNTSPYDQQHNQCRVYLLTVDHSHTNVQQTCQYQSLLDLFAVNHLRHCLHAITPTTMLSHMPTFHHTCLHAITPTTMLSHMPTCHHTCHHAITPATMPSHLPTCHHTHHHAITPAYMPSYLPACHHTCQHVITPAYMPSHRPPCHHTCHHAITPTTMPSHLPTCHHTCHHAITPTTMPSHLPTCHHTCLHVITPAYMSSHLPACHHTYLHAITSAYTPSHLPTLVNVTPVHTCLQSIICAAVTMPSIHVFMIGITVRSMSADDSMNFCTLVTLFSSMSCSCCKQTINTWTHDTPLACTDLLTYCKALQPLKNGKKHKFTVHRKFV